MGYIEMSQAPVEVLFAWLVEEVGELGLCLVRKRFSTETPEKELKLELGDVWNTLHAIGFKLKLTPSAMKSVALQKGQLALQGVALPP